MDQLTDPFDTAEQNNTKPLADQWAEFLDKGGRSAIAQAGLQMMQPIGWGESPMGNLGYALGSAGEALRTSQAVDQKGAAATRKEEAAQARDEAQQRRLQIQEERLQLQKDRGTGRGARALYGKKAAPAPAAPPAEPETDENGDPIAAAAQESAPAAPSPSDAIIQEAKAAIARGADPTAVKARLRAMNIIPRGL